MRDLVYADESRYTLNEVERAYVLARAGREWPRMLDDPVVVTDGYEWCRTGPNPTRAIIGRARIHEGIAVEHLSEQPAGNGLRGLYYPGATPSRSLLCQAALYFDEVFLIHPGSTLSRAEDQRWFRKTDARADRDEVAEFLAGYDAFLARLLEFDREVLPLKQAGILYAMPPQMQEDPNFIKLITADLGDPEFRAIAGSDWRAPVFVAARKLEPLLPFVGPDTATADRIRDDLQDRASYDTDGGVGDLFRSGFGVKQVDPTLAATIMLNHALLLSDRQGLVPFTDDPLSSRLMQCKLNRLNGLRGYADFRRELHLGTATLAIRVLAEQLPRFRFTDADDVIEARHRLRDHLAAFREAMRSFAGEIEESPYDAEFGRRVEQVVATKVRPAIAALEDEVRTSRDRFVSRVMRNAQVGSVPIVASIFAGLPATAVVGLSAGVLTFEAVIETYLELRGKKRNGLTLFLKV